MKTTYRFIIAALAATVALSSCTKDIAADRQDTGLQDGVRTIAVSFAAQTKTTLDGLQPRFDDGDVIKVSNGSECKDITIQVDPQTNNAFFTTTLTGALKAVYPATAAKLNGNAIEGVKVPVFQTGKFKEANICMANIDANATSATFHNKTAILRFYVDQSVDVRVITIICKDGYISTESIEGLTAGTARDRKLIYILSEVPENIKNLPEPEEMAPLSTATDDPNKRLCYAAILPLNEDAIQFVGITSMHQARMQYKNVSLGEGDIANAFIPYYIKVRVGGTNDEPVFQRWSYCNIGAFLPEEAGYYYSWGNTTGHWRNGVSDEYPFDSEIYKSSKGAGLTNNIQPTSEYDAAYAAWANGEENTWRMPTKGEFETLLAAKPSVTGEGLVFAEGLKFPFAGLVEGNKLITKTYEGDYKAMQYWTSSISEGGTKAYCMMAMSKPYTLVSYDSRYYGVPIRPIYGAPAEPEEADSGLTIGELTDGGMVE